MSHFLSCWTYCFGLWVEMPPVIRDKSSLGEKMDLRWGKAVLASHGVHQLLQGDCPCHLQVVDGCPVLFPVRGRHWARAGALAGRHLEFLLHGNS